MPIIPSGREVFFREDEIIVSKTDLHGKLTYANDIFMKISGFEERELIGMPHSMIRHPEMPRAVFKLLWTTIGNGSEIFAYVKNLCKNGDHYWVFAHVTPTYNTRNEIIGYHSNRRVPDRANVTRIDELYKVLCNEERKYSDKKSACDASTKLLLSILEREKATYEEFVFQNVA